jgi:hypothetical protein
VTISGVPSAGVVTLSAPISGVVTQGSPIIFGA